MVGTIGKLMTIITMVTVVATAVLAADCVPKKATTTIDGLNLTRLGDRSYYFDFEKRTQWEPAQQFCRSHGLEMVSVETKEENNLIVQYIRRKVPGRKGLVFWLSGREQKDKWQWTSGRPFTFTDWRRGEPHKSIGDEECLVMTVSWGTLNWWNTERCIYGFWVMCELENVCT